jgi:hypothetical protein
MARSSNRVSARGDNHTTEQPGEQQQQGQPLSSPAAPVPPPRTPQEADRHSSPLPDQPIEENLGA